MWFPPGLRFHKTQSLIWGLIHAHKYRVKLLITDSALVQLIPAASSGASPLESVPEGESAAIAAITKTISARVRATAKPGLASRDAHPKAHGCVAATLTVLGDLPEALSQGLFATAACYPCWVRFSNGSGTPQADKIGDGRGMAVKVMDVAASPSTTQDFVMINNPVFFVRNACDYVDFNAATNQVRFFLPGWNPFRFRIHELLVAMSITRRVVSNPLNVQYYTMTPYLMGDVACKFSWRPMGTPSPFIERSSVNFLHDNLVAALGSGDARFELCVQLRTDAASMPIEDPTIEWSEESSPYVAVAHLLIHKQVFDTPERVAFGEALSFTPWHGLDAHRPLGGINRVRRVVYETISALRHNLNHVARVEPTDNRGAEAVS
jgi:Catalase